VFFGALFMTNFELISNVRLGANAPRHAPARLMPRLRYFLRARFLAFADAKAIMKNIITS